MDAVLTPKNDTETKQKTLPLFKVIVHNDDVNTMDHVVRVFIQLFHFDVQEAIEKMLKVHNEGLCIVKIEPKEHAELHQEQLTSFSLSATIEEA